MLLAAPLYAHKIYIPDPNALIGYNMYGTDFHRVGFQKNTLYTKCTEWDCILTPHTSNDPWLKWFK